MSNKPVDDDEDPAPVCEECNAEMERYEDAGDTGMGGYACPECGWSWDDK